MNNFIYNFGIGFSNTQVFFSTWDSRQTMTWPHDHGADAMTWGHPTTTTAPQQPHKLNTYFKKYTITKPLQTRRFFPPPKLLLPLQHLTPPHHTQPQRLTPPQQLMGAESIDASFKVFYCLCCSSLDLLAYLNGASFVYGAGLSLYYWKQPKIALTYKIVCRNNNDSNNVEIYK